jgi:hypothetical protein
VRKIKIAVLVLIALSAVSGLVFFFIYYFKPKAAGLLIETTPASTVFINGQQMGRTPYKNTHDPQETVIKLIPESFETPLAPYETKILLVSGVETVVRRDFGESDEASSGEIISFEKIDRNETGLSAVTIPDSAQLLIDGVDRAFTPYKTSSITPEEHSLSLSATGYADKTIKVKTNMGYQLTAFVKLAPTEEVVEETPDEAVVEEEEIVEMVKILPTGVGFLRVRSEPSTLSDEVAKVEPGEIYELLEEDEKTGWFKIKYQSDSEDEQTGWISNQYAKKVESRNESSPTPTEE